MPNGVEHDEGASPEPLLCRAGKVRVKGSWLCGGFLFQSLEKGADMHRYIRAHCVCDVCLYDHHVVFVTSVHRI